MDPVLARRTWRTLEPVHGMIYFAPEAAERYDALGITGRAGYFASRAAAMGPVGAELVLATFFNFPPELVRRCIPGAWDHATPAQVLDARYSAADAALHRAFDGADVAEAATLARRAAEEAAGHMEGRPLFAAHASVPWPDEPRLVLWHAQTLLREFRGDGHIAALVAEGISGIEALVLHVATGEVPEAAIRRSRPWSDEAWDAAVEGLRARGLLDADGLTPAGRAHRQWVEDRTDAAAVVAYEPLGEAGCARLRELGRPLSQAVIAAGLLPL
ncbi:MAG: hypothetical protein JWO68_2686 [Actinomycetia bacterium]|nr:hypothetical protein [Actinomycetes bacterium]